MSSFKPLILESDWRGGGYQLPGPASAPAAAGSGGKSTVQLGRTGALQDLCVNLPLVLS